jgi:transposase
MSIFNIAPYFPFRRIKIVKQTVLPNASEARIQAEPDKRFQPICYFCGQKAATVHSWTQRTVRDKHGHHPGLDCLSLSQAVLSSLPQYQYRRFRVISSLSASDYPINTSKLEGINNKIKVIKRKAYGYHDLRYFTLKIYQAFYN